MVGVVCGRCCVWCVMCVVSCTVVVCGVVCGGRWDVVWCFRNFRNGRYVYEHDP